MRNISVISVVIFALSSWARGEVLEFDLSPPGTDAAVGLHPANEVLAGMVDPATAGTGGAFGTGLLFDTSTRMLSIAIGYGSVEGFTDLIGPAFAWFLHGPAPVGETAPVMHNLAALHTFGSDHAAGGRLVGSLSLTPDEASSLLAGLTYLNIYTEARLGGEIRGQLVAQAHEPAEVPDGGVPTLAIAVLLGALAGVRCCQARARGVRA